MAQTYLSSDSLGNVRCSRCHGYLSVPPINMVDGKYTCGRCNKTTSKKSRVMIYEELAKYLMFPCNYKDCSVLLSWTQVVDHERHCRHRPICCPIYNCNIQCLKQNLHQHLTRFHPDRMNLNGLVSKRKLRDMPPKNFQIDKLTHYFIYDSILYMLMVYGECVPDETSNHIKSYSYHFDVLSCCKLKQDVNYNLTVTMNFTGNNFEKYIWNNQVPKEYEDTVHCFNCITNTCRKSGHRRLGMKVLSCQMDNIKQNPNLTSITYSVQVYKKPPQINPSKKQKIITNLLCPICAEYMCAPIYMCPKGHSICCNCRDRLAKCHFCKETLNGIRNHELEKIAEQVQVPCYNLLNGCKLTDTIKKIKAHMVDCRFHINPATY